MKYSSFTDMPVWNEAMDLAVEVNSFTLDLPRKEDYALTSQINRSASSIPANITEGFGRNTSPDKARFYIIARGSAYETQNHLVYGNRIKYFPDEKTHHLFEAYQELIHSLNKIIKSLNN